MWNVFFLCTGNVFPARNSIFRSSAGLWKDRTWREMDCVKIFRAQSGKIEWTEMEET